MSKVTKWKPEKLKVKVVFRLQFHATHIPQKGWEKLFISFIPTDTGKATAKTSKANVRNGICKWADPVYETTRLLLDSTSKQYDDKLYRLVVGLGTSRSSILGEATINLADYADASQPAAISLPLTGSDHGTILHVSVQLLTSKTGFREFEQQRDKGLQSGNNVNKETEPNTARSSYSDLESLDDQMNKAKTQVQNIHEECSDSPVTFEGSSNASESYNAHDVDSVKSKVSAESSITELKMELSLLQSHANEMGNETEKFSQELASEIASGQELSKEVTFLKSECSKLKTDLKKLTEMKLSSQCKKVKGVLLVEDQIRNLQEKVYAGSHEPNFLKSDFEVLFNTVQDLKKDAVEPESKLLSELEVAKSENENLVKKMNQMESYYEGLVQELEENQKRILGEFQTLKNEHSACKAVNNELQKRATTSESALKRARLNYSIAVSQLQKDLDMLSFQVLSMFETNQTVIKESFIDTSPPSSKHLVSDDMKKSLSIQENIYKKVEEELGEMCSVNVHLDVYSATLKETLFEASSHIRKTNQKLQLLNQSRDVLNAQNAYYLANCNDLQMRNELLETDVGNLSNENFLLMEKITECEALLADYKVYKSKHEAVSAEKRELEDFLRSEIRELTRSKETVQKENDNLKRTFTNTLREMVAKMEIPNVSLDKLRLQVDSVANKFKTSLESGEMYVENGEVIVSYLSNLELELEKMLSEDKYFVEQIKGLEIMSEEAEKSKLIVTELKKENHDLKIIVENKHAELSKLVLELSHRESENSRKTVQHEESLDTLHKERAAEDLKLIFIKTQYEGKIDELVTHLRELENKHVDDATRYLQENEKMVKTVESLKARYMDENETLSTTLEYIRFELEACLKSKAELQTKMIDTESRLIQCLENETRYMEENGKLSTDLESVRLELDALVAHNAEILESKNERAVEVGQLRDMLTKSESEAGKCIELQAKLHDTESRLNVCLENETCHIEEHRKLATELETVRLELEASVSQNANLEVELSEVNNQRAVELDQLNERVASEARYVEENEKLSTALESLRLELEASVSRNSEILESRKEHGQLKDMLSKLEAQVGQYKELELKLDETDSRLNQYLENEARYTAENEKLRYELKASVAHNAEILESKNEHVLEVDQLKDMLTKLEAKIGLYSKLETKLHDTESRLNHCLENEARYVEENRHLASEIDSLRSKLEADDSLQSREESEILSLVLKAKLDEQNDAFVTLQNKYSELKNKLVEQSLKTEEYKNLSTYLKELKENGDMAREKKDNNPEGPSESLRLAFIKEQYQAKIQDLKQQLSVTKKHNEEMLFKLQDALESMKKSDNNKADYDRIQAELECALLSLECCKEEKEKLVGLLREREDEKMKLSEELGLVRAQNGYTGVNGSPQGIADCAYGCDKDSLVNNDDSSKQLTVVNDQFRAQHLRSCMEQLDEELERMKNDNTLLPLANYDPSVQDLQRELAQLRQANEELGSIYPNFVDFPGNGNALERVLALEIELAEALRNKKKPSIQFQSSFLKQHSDDEAIFKSFRDINELIKDMLEIKGKYVNVESELKEMHDRYSQLSLQFAEVEGERQKLMMTLKNVRSSRNLLRRSSLDHAPL